MTFRSIFIIAFITAFTLFFHCTGHCRYEKPVRHIRSGHYFLPKVDKGDFFFLFSDHYDHVGYLSPDMPTFLSFGQFLSIDVLFSGKALLLCCFQCAGLLYVAGKSSGRIIPGWHLLLEKNLTTCAALQGFFTFCILTQGSRARIRSLLHPGLRCIALSALLMVTGNWRLATGDWPLPIRSVCTVADLWDPLARGYRVRVEKPGREWAGNSYEPLRDLQAFH